MKLFWMLVLCFTVIQLDLSAATSKIRRGLHFPNGNFPRHLRAPRDAEKMCTYEEFDKKTDPLFCQESHLAALNAAIEQSNCKNAFLGDEMDYDYDYENVSSFPCEIPRNERENVRNCTEECSFRELLYIFCTTIGKQYADITRECGIDPVDSVLYCGFDKGDFCHLKYNLTESPYEKCAVNNTIECSASCKTEVETYVEKSGCCAYYWKDYYDGYENGNDETTISDIISACDVEIPNECIVNFDPPKEFLDCARDLTVNEGATLIASLLMAFVGAKLALIFAVV